MRETSLVASSGTVVAGKRSVGVVNCNTSTGMKNTQTTMPSSAGAVTRAAAAAAFAVLAASACISPTMVEGRVADRSRVVKARYQRGVYDRHRDNGRAIEGPAYRNAHRWDADDEERKRTEANAQQKGRAASAVSSSGFNDELPFNDWEQQRLVAASAGENRMTGDPELSIRGTTEDNTMEDDRKLSSQLTGCCYNYQSYSAVDLCGLYGNDCESGETPSHDSGDDDCSMEGLSFIGVSFSVNTANGNPYSYQLCDQFPMENIIDRNYDYVMSMDEDGWLVGGGYKTFDYSGKMPYIDSSHTELLRVGSMDPDRGGTSIQQVYKAMESVSFPPFSIFPEYLKGGGGHHSGDDNDEGGVPSGDVTLIVSVVETYEDNDNYSVYDKFLDDLFSAMYNVGAGPCMDDHDTDPHVSMARGVKFKSSWHSQQYTYEKNLEVAVWQAMYPYGVTIGANGYASFPPGRGGQRQYVGYGNLYFFFDRANITKAFPPSRSLTDDESYYATLYMSTDVSQYYSDTTEIGFDYSGSGDGGDGDWEHNPYGWKATMAMHDMTDGWDLPPNCNMEGETFFGIPLSRKSDSKLQSTGSFQEQFDFEYLIDKNYSYVKSFGTNHGWLIGEEIGNAIGSIVDKDTAHIPIFYTGTTNPDMGGMSLGDMIKVVKHIDFGTLYIKPAFVFVDDSGHLKLQFEADATSALAYLYDSLCKELGIAWNYESPQNDLGLYTNCAMHAAGDRAKYGCGPDNSNTGGFCPQMTIAYSVRFFSEDHAAAYLDMANNYVDYWRSLYPSGVAVGTSKFCSEGGCLGLFLNRYDLFNVFKPDLGGSWVEYHGASMAPTYSPAPTWKGGCDNPHNRHLDKCFRKMNKPRRSAVAWDSLGSVGQFSVILVCFMAITLALSIFLARARKRRRKGESYMAFFIRDLTRKRRRKKKVRRKKRGNMSDLEERMLPEDRERRRSRSKSAGRSRSRSKSRHRSSRSKSRGRSNTDVSRGTERTKAIRPMALQPEQSSSSRARSRSRGTSSRNRGGSVAATNATSGQKSGMMDLSVLNPQNPSDPEVTENRTQLV